MQTQNQSPVKANNTSSNNDIELSLVPTDEELGVHVPVNHLERKTFFWTDMYRCH